MRITLNIDDDVLAVARALADRSGSSLGSALSELARHGYKSPSTFRVPADAEIFTSDDVYRSLREWP